MDRPQQEIFEKGQFWKDNLEMTILKRKIWKKDKSDKETYEKENPKRQTRKN